MLWGICQLLGFQCLGELVSRGLGLPVPGPVVGLVALFAWLLVRRRDVNHDLAQAAQGLLTHLGLLFVPAAAGVMLYWRQLADQGLGVAVALVASTLGAIGVASVVFRAMSHATPVEAVDGTDEDTAP